MTTHIEDKTLRNLVNSIVKSYEEAPDLIKIEERIRINTDAVNQIIEDLRALMYAGFFDPRKLTFNSVEYYVGELVERLDYNLQKQITQALMYIDLKRDIDSAREEAAEKTYEFLSRIPNIRRVLATDIDATFDNDPAAFSKEEIILSYPGIYAITVARLAHELCALSIPLIPRMMTEHAHSTTGIDIHPGASIGHHFFIDHGTGIVIGETTIIGNHAKIYQGVTIGALSTSGGQNLTGVKRHPTIEDDVTIYSGASILGGDTVIGSGTIIGSNAFITTSMPAGSRVSIKGENHDIHVCTIKGKCEMLEG
jgi:serine O-acetyltransferase